MLEDLLESQLTIQKKEEELKKLKIENGLDVLEKELKALKELHAIECQRFADQGILSDGDIQLMDVGRDTDVIRVSDFIADQHDLAIEFSTIPITKLKEKLVKDVSEENPTLKKVEVNKIVGEMLAPYVDKKHSTSWKVIKIASE